MPQVPQTLEEALKAGWTPAAASVKPIPSSPKPPPTLAEADNAGWMPSDAGIRGPLTRQEQNRLTNTDVVSWLPLIGQLAGAFAGGGAGPGGAIVGGGLGAATGESIRQLISRLIPTVTPPPVTSMEAATRLGTQAAIGAGGEALGVAAGKVIPKIAEMVSDSATTSAIGMLRPRGDIAKFEAREIAPEVVRRGIVGTRKAVEAKAAVTRSAVGAQVDAAFQSIPKFAKVNTDKIITALEKARDAYKVQGIAVEPEAIAQFDGFIDIIKQFGPRVSPDSLRATRQIWDEIVSRSGGYAGKEPRVATELFARKQAANAIRHELNAAFPSIEKLNNEFSFWASLDDLMKQASLKETGGAGNIVTRRDIMMQGLGVGAAVSMFGLPGVLASPGIVALDTLMSSVLWKSVSAQSKNVLAKLLADGKVIEAGKFAARISAQLATKESSDDAK